MATQSQQKSFYPNFPKRPISLFESRSMSASTRTRPMNLGIKALPVKKNLDLKDLQMNQKLDSNNQPEKCLYICETDSSLEYDKKGPAEIRPYLMLGSQEHVSKLNILNNWKIDSILNVSNDIKNYFPNNFVYNNQPVMDSSSQDITTIFDKCFSFIDDVRAKNGKVIVHCYAGVSRSATICIAYLMKNEGLSLRDAINEVKEKRPVIAPNLGFLGQLLEYERLLHGERLLNKRSRSIISNRDSYKSYVPIAGDQNSPGKETSKRLSLRSNSLGFACFPGINSATAK